MSDLTKLNGPFSLPEEFEQMIEDDIQQLELELMSLDTEGKLQIYAACLIALVNSALQDGISLEQLLAALPEE